MSDLIVLYVMLLVVCEHFLMDMVYAHAFTVMHFYLCTAIIDTMQ